MLLLQAQGEQQTVANVDLSVFERAITFRRCVCNCAPCHQEPVIPDFTTPVDVANIKLSRPSRAPERSVGKYPSAEVVTD